MNGYRVCNKTFETKDKSFSSFARTHIGQLTRYLTIFVTALITVFALFTSSLSWAQQSFQPSVRISGGLAETIERSDFQISADGQRVVYLASQAIDQNLVNELYSVSISGGAASRLSANLTIPRSVEVFNSVARSVSPFQISPDSQRVVYVADQNTNGVFELFSVSITGGAIVRLNADLPAGGNVTVAGESSATNGRPDFLISSDSQNVVYVADQNADDLYKLFSVPIQGGEPVRLNPDLGTVFFRYS